MSRMRTMTWEMVAMIRAIATIQPPLTHREIGLRVGLPIGIVSPIIGGRAWKDRDYIPLRRKGKLTWPQVRIIRAERAKGVTQAALAKRFNVSAVSIHQVIVGRTWANDPAAYVSALQAAE